MKCENCADLCKDGYEYPEYYCELGIADNPKYEKYDTGDGCTVPKRKRIEICKELTPDEEFDNLWWNEYLEKKARGNNQIN